MTRLRQARRRKVFRSGSRGQHMSGWRRGIHLNIVIIKFVSCLKPLKNLHEFYFSFVKFQTHLFLARMRRARVLITVWGHLLCVYEICSTVEGHMMIGSWRDISVRIVCFRKVGYKIRTSEKSNSSKEALLLFTPANVKTRGLKN